MRYLRRLGLATVAAMALAVIGSGSASATELYKSTESPDVPNFTNVTQGSGTEVQGSLKTGSSLALADTGGFSIVTCTGSEIGMKTETAGGEAAHPSGKVSTLTFSGCSNSVTVHAKGSLEIKHVAGTTNGTVTSSGMEVTTGSVFGTLNCKTGGGTHLGTLTGVADESHATLDVNAVINCSGISSRLTGTYTITTPTGLNVEPAANSGTELYKSTESPYVNNATQGPGTKIQASIKTGSSWNLTDTFGFTSNTCTGSEIEMQTESAGGEAAHPSGKVLVLAFSGCSRPVAVHKNGSLEIKHITGTTNGTVTSSGMEVTSGSPFGTINCVTGAGTDIGTLTGVNFAEGHAMLDVNVVLSCSGISSRLTGTYTITSPTGLNVEAK